MAIPTAIMLHHSHGWDRQYRSPSLIPASTGGDGPSGRLVGCITARHPALTAKLIASSPKAQAGPVAATMIPPASGPTRYCASDALSDDSELADISSPGGRMSAVMAVDAGL